MRKMVALAAVAALLGGCGVFRHPFSGLDSPGYTEPKSTTVWGDWVLASSPDSTSFVGANQVELALNNGAFTLTANYPGAAPVVVTGAASLAQGGILTLTPSTGVSDSHGAGLAINFVPGRPISFLASASGNTMVFAPNDPQAGPRPTSIWNRRAAAEAAGLVAPERAMSRDSSRKP